MVINVILNNLLVSLVYESLVKYFHDYLKTTYIVILYMYVYLMYMMVQ
jgi:hypothetical protein